MTTSTTTTFAPGRVNLIGEHTDYTGGRVLPMALELGVTLTARRGGDRLAIDSDGHPPLDIPVGPDRPTPVDLAGIEPAWGRFLVAVARRLGVSPAMTGSISSTLPIGGTGLSSSTALTCAALLAYGATGQPLELAQLARQAEIDATGVQIGLMDQAASLAGRRDHALLMDCGDLTIRHVEVPRSMEVLVIHSGHGRELAGSAYNQRRQECATIEQRIGPLRSAGLDALAELDEPVLRRRARHVISENERVLAMVDALAADDPQAVGAILAAGHASLAQDYEVSIPPVDELVDRLSTIDGIHGVRMTGGGFGGSLVAVCRPGTAIDVTTWWTRARPGNGARVIE